MSDRKWRALTLGDVATLEYGAALPATIRFGDEFPVFGSNGEVGRHSAALIKGPGIIVGRKGTVGALAWSRHDFWPIDTAYYVKVARNFDLRWFYWALSQLGLRRLDSSTGVPGLNRNDVYRLAFKVPPIIEQRQIAAILDVLEEQIASSSLVVQKLQDLHKGLLMSFFEGDSVRNSCRWIPLGDLVDRNRPIVYGILMPGEHFPNGVPVVKVKDMKTGSISPDGLLLTSPSIDREYRRSRLQAGDVLLSIRGTVGRVCIVGPQLNGANITQDTARISLPNSLQRFAAHYLTSPDAQRFIDSETVGLAVRGINLRDVRRIQIPILPKGQAEMVVDALDASRFALNCEEARLSKLTQLMESLARDLLSGRVRVPEQAAS
ncbi:MAG TPA: restriction endonuclease subunit S [Pseudonocardiaceae bacterium]